MDRQDFIDGVLEINARRSGPKVEHAPGSIFGTTWEARDKDAVPVEYHRVVVTGVVQMHAELPPEIVYRPAGFGPNMTAEPELFAQYFRRVVHAPELDALTATIARLDELTNDTEETSA